MNTTVRRAVSLLLAGVLLFTLCPGAYAGTEAGMCGECTAWTLNTETGALVIDGTGAVSVIPRLRSAISWRRLRCRTRYGLSGSVRFIIARR